VEPLPHIDEHATEVAAGTEATWEALLRVVEGSFGSSRTGRIAGLLGCDDVDSSGPRPLASGSTFPGFHVELAEPPGELAEPPGELALAGNHRFSNYALIFRLDRLDANRTRLRAETRADFPHLKGSVYRTLVIGTRGHVLVTRRLLNATKQRAERA
jgi:hypothetical protein